MGKEREEKKRKASPGNYWTRLGSWGNLSGTHRSHWWGCGRQDHMERGLWLCSLKLVTRLLQSPWAECEMRLARPNVLHMHHLCHKTNLINVNYVAAIISRGPAEANTQHYVRAHTRTGREVRVWGPRAPLSRPGALGKHPGDSSKKTHHNTQEWNGKDRHGDEDVKYACVIVRAYTAGDLPHSLLGPSVLHSDVWAAVSAAAHGCSSLMRWAVLQRGSRLMRAVEMEKNPKKHWILCH